MAWETMYPANPGSPYTTLASGIDEDDTSISLTADPGFAAATNLACIWDDTGNFEVVKYTDLTGTTLTVERAFEGSARVWSAGAYIANLIPAYAINSLQNNVNELNSGKIAASGVTYENLNANGDVGSVAGTVCAGDDSRLSDSRTPTSHGNEAHSTAYQPADATLTALAGVTTAAGKYPYFSGVDAAGVLDLPSGYNYIINPCFEINQQGVSTYTSETTPSNSDDTYLMDQWILLSDGNDIVDVSLDTSGVFAGCRCSLKAEVETANKKFGFLQLFESVNSIPFRNQVISVSFKAKTASGKVINNVRCAVLEWTGTADAVTSDCVNAWGNQGTNPTWATSWAALNTSANLALTTSEQTFKIENITVGASCNNLGLFVWVDDTDAAADDLLYLSAVKFEIGSVATQFVAKPFAEELQHCKWYYQTATGYMPLMYIDGSGSTQGMRIDFETAMRVAPTVILTTSSVYHLAETTTSIVSDVVGFVDYRLVTNIGSIGYSCVYNASSRL